MHVLIKNSTVINTDGQAKQDLLIESRIVHQLGNNISPQLPYEEIDATGCYIFPGSMDVHTHFNIDVSITRSCDDFFTSTHAAACGSTTTIIDHMGFGPNSCQLHHQLEVYHGYATHKAVINYSFHSVIQHINHTILNKIPMMVKEGLSSFKLYLTYQYKLNNDKVLQALHHLHESSALTTMHPENDTAITSKQAEFITTGLTTPRYHTLSRPLECKAEAIAHMINLAQIASNTPLYIMHLSNSLGLDYLHLAHANHQPVWVETCPQYLLLDKHSYNTEDGMKFILSPPLHNIHEQDKLWCGISNGAIDMVATNHCTFSMAQRLQISKGNFSRCPNGLPSVENHMQLLFSSGMMTGHITPEHFVELTSTMPTRLFGLWPQKGLLAPSSNSNMVIINPHQSQQIQHHHLHNNTNYSPWEGFTCQGTIVRTLSHGETIFCDSTFTGKARQGHFLQHKPFVPPML